MPPERCSCPPGRVAAFLLEQCGSHFEGRFLFLDAEDLSLCFNSIGKKRGRKKCRTLDGAVQHLFKPSEYSRLLGLQRGAEQGWDGEEEGSCLAGSGCGGQGDLAGQGSPGLRFHPRSVTANCSAKQK